MRKYKRRIIIHQPPIISSRQHRKISSQNAKYYILRRLKFPDPLVNCLQNIHRISYNIFIARFMTTSSFDSINDKEYLLKYI